MIDLMNLRVHISDTNTLTENLLDLTDKQPSMHFKPIGLWYSSNNDWLNWMKKNDYNIHLLPKMKNYSILLCSEDLTVNFLDKSPDKVLLLDVKDSFLIQLFCNKYAGNTYDILDTIDRLRFCKDQDYQNTKYKEIRNFKYGKKNTENIRWIDVAKDFAGIEIINLHESKISFLGWDVDSGCIWRPFHFNIKLLK